jgi:hypothetical protein
MHEVFIFFFLYTILSFMVNEMNSMGTITFIHIGLFLGKNLSREHGINGIKHLFNFTFSTHMKLSGTNSNTLYIKNIWVCLKYFKLFENAVLICGLELLE